MYDALSRDHYCYHHLANMDRFINEDLNIRVMLVISLATFAISTYVSYTYNLTKVPFPDWCSDDFEVSISFFCSVIDLRSSRQLCK